MKKLTFLIFSLMLSTAVYSQNKMVKGGRPETITKTLEQFSKIYVNLNADINIEIGQMPMIMLTANSKLLKHINTAITNNELRLETEKGYWLLGPKPKITIQVPFLTMLKTEGKQTGIGTISVKGIEVETFTVDMLFGNLILQGKTETLILKSSNRSYYKSQGICDASTLKAMDVIANIEGSNTASVNALKNLKVDLKYDAKLTYQGEPSSIKVSGKAEMVSKESFAVVSSQPKTTTKVSKRTELNYINLTIKNNSAMRKQFVISGPNPSGKTFSYGFPMNPFAKREERVPVGTKFFAQSIGMKGKKLLEVKAEDEGKILDLF